VRFGSFRATRLPARPGPKRGRPASLVASASTAAEGSPRGLGVRPTQGVDAGPRRRGADAVRRVVDARRRPLPSASGPRAHGGSSYDDDDGTHWRGERALDVSDGGAGRRRGGAGAARRRGRSARTWAGPPPATPQRKVGNSGRHGPTRRTRTGRHYASTSLTVEGGDVLVGPTVINGPPVRDAPPGPTRRQPHRDPADPGRHRPPRHAGGPPAWIFFAKPKGAAASSAGFGGWAHTGRRTQRTCASSSSRGNPTSA